MDRIHFVQASAVADVVCIRSCVNKPQLPADVQERITEFIQNDGCPPPKRIFTMPSSLGSSNDSSSIQVTSIRHQASVPPASRDIGIISKGTVVHYYRVDFTRTDASGSERGHKDLAIFVDATVQRHIVEGLDKNGD